MLPPYWVSAYFNDIDTGSALLLTQIPKDYKDKKEPDGTCQLMTLRKREGCFIEAHKIEIPCVSSILSRSLKVSYP